jgi:tetratricopeptide (TPR) repeat protein
MLSYRLLPLLLLICCSNVFAAAEDWFEGLSDDLPNVPANVQQLHHKMLGHKNANDLESAIETGLEIVDRLADGPEKSLIRPLLNVGLLQMYTGKSDLAISNMQRCVELVEATEGVFSPQLIQPLYSLGYAYKRTGSQEQAVDIFRRAQHIIHRHDGVYSSDQLDVIDQLTELSVAKGDFASAGREQYFSLKISEAEFGSDSLELIPALDKYALYLKDIGRFRHSVGYYERTITIIENRYGAMDIRLIEPLQNIAAVRIHQQEAVRFGITRSRVKESGLKVNFNSQSSNPRGYLLQNPERPRTDDGEEALERALTIISEYPESDITDHIRAIVRLGDMYTISGDSRASDLYKQAAQMMQGREDLEELNNDLFGLPSRIQPRNTHVLPLYTSGDAGSYYADVEMTVKPDGRTGNIRITDANIPNQERKRLKQMIFRYRYRPKMVDGEMVSTDMGIQQRYYPMAINTNTGARTKNTGTLTSDPIPAVDGGIAN